MRVVIESETGTTEYHEGSTSGQVAGQSAGTGQAVPAPAEYMAAEASGIEGQRVTGIVEAPAAFRGAAVEATGGSDSETLPDDQF